MAPIAAVPDSVVTVRPWRPGDEHLIAAAEPLISLASFYSRFFTGGHTFPARYVDRLAAQITVVAVADGAAVGWAEVARRSEPSYVADLGVLVVDAWQHRRVGPLLVHAVLDAARRRGVSLVHADVMDTNTAARRALARMFGDRIHVTDDGDVRHYVVPLVPAFAPAERRAT